MDEKGIRLKELEDPSPDLDEMEDWDDDDFEDEDEADDDLDLKPAALRPNALR